MKTSKDLAIVILAAGKSTRLEDKTKQLLKYKEETLLKIAVKKAFKISNNVYVVLGHKREECKAEIREFDINILENLDFDKGIGSSISFGIKHTKDFENTMIVLCDQPFIPLTHLEKLKKNIDNQTIVASLYENSQSSTVPAIFPKKYYEKLLLLDEDKGAKSILKQNDCINIKLQENYSIDIDTKEDVEEFLT